MVEVSKSVSSDRLLSILALGRDIELVPEPYSGQPELNLIIPFGSFVRLCEDIGTYGAGLLSYSSMSLQNLVALHNRGNAESTRKLQSIFMQEVAYSIIKEIYYSERRGKGVTKISHIFSEQNVKQLTDDEMARIFMSQGAQKDMIPQLLSYTSSRGYVLKDRISDLNMHAYIYAVVLYTLSGILPFNAVSTKK